MLSMNFSDSYHVFHSTHFWIRELYAEWKKHYRSGWQDKGPEKWSVWTHQSTWWHCSRAIGLFHHQWLPPSRTRVGSDHTGDSQEQTSAWKFPHGKCILTWKWPPGHLPWLRKTMVFPETLIPALERMYHLYLTSTRSCLSETQLSLRSWIENEPATSSMTLDIGYLVAWGYICNTIFLLFRVGLRALTLN